MLRAGIEQGARDRQERLGIAPVVLAGEAYGDSGSGACTLARLRVLCATGVGDGQLVSENTMEDIGNDLA